MADFIQVNCLPEELVPKDFFSTTGSDSNDVNDRWNVFVEITDGDASLPHECDFENPLTPSELLDSEYAQGSYVYVGGYMKSEQPTWWEKFTESREQARSPWSGDFYFRPVGTED